MTVHFAETVFRWLMRAYPARFRRTHGLALFELFRDDARGAHHARGTIGLLTVLAKATADTLRAAPGEWFERGPTKPTRPTRPTWPARPTLDLSGCAQDVRIAARHLRKSPGFA